MSFEKVDRWRCDRCGAIAERPPMLTADNDPKPEGWIPLREMCMDICDLCADEVRTFIASGHLVHIGHYRQSGSGKSFTELGLERRDDPDRWQPAYAFFMDGRKPR